MKLVSSEVGLKDGSITIEGRDVFGDLIVPAQFDEAVRRATSLSNSLPDEDTKAGYVMPATILTVSGSS